MTLRLLSYIKNLAILPNETVSLHFFRDDGGDHSPFPQSPNTVDAWIFASLLFSESRRPQCDASDSSLFLFFLVGVYFFAASSGTHEVTNYLNTRFCEAGKIKSSICNIISYNDDEFSHYVYYAGLVLMNIVLLKIQYKVATKSAMNTKDRWLIGINASLVGLGIFANLAFEEIGIDLWVFAFLAALSLYLWSRRRTSIKNYPIIYYSGLSYGIGTVGTFLYKFLA